jgi:adenosylcobyric acid synthase
MKNSNIKNKGIMVQGTASSVGKSMLTAALCRIFTQDGYDVNPFKSQNMSLNSFITHEGHEMGRAQVMQAEAAGKAPTVEMNPILLKPTTDRKSQVIIEGKVYDNMDAVDYFAFKKQLKGRISDIYSGLADKSDIVVIEGAGSPAEINLKQEDFVNMGMAKIAKAPVILVGDIDRGGVFASLAGTLLLLDEDEKKLVKGVIINKFRGSLEILEPGLRMLEDIIKVPVLGVVPYYNHYLEDEDSVSDWLQHVETGEKEIEIAVICLPYMSNFTDFNALRLYKGVKLKFVRLHEELGNPDVIMIPGTKSTIKDMQSLKQSQMDKKILACHQNGSVVFGICGGFQILGNKIHDPLRSESDLESIEGLSLLDCETVFKPIKTTTLSEGIEKVFGSKVKGYEIHMGEALIKSNEKSFIDLNIRNGKGYEGTDGIVNENLTVFGTYIHGIFDSKDFTSKFINLVRQKKGLGIEDYTEVPDYWEFKEKQYDELAEIVRNSLDIESIYKILEEGIYD